MRKNSDIPQSVRPLCWLIFVVPFAMGGFYSFLCFPISAILLICLLRGAHQQKELIFDTGICTMGLVFLLVSAVLSPLWAADKGTAAFGILRVLPIFLFYLNMRQAPKQDWKVLLRFVPESAVVMTCLSIVLAQIPSCQGAVLVADRLAGFFGYPNTFALFLLVAFLLTAMQRKGTLRLVYCGVLSAGIAMSGSRTTFALFVVFFAALLLWKGRAEKKGYLAIIAVAICCTLLSYFLTHLSEGNATDRLLTISPKSGTFLGRLIYAKDGIVQALSHPFGMGYGGFRAAQGSFQTAYYAVSFVHNSILQLFLDYGWIPAGLLLYSLLTSVFSKKTAADVRILLLALLCHGLLDFDGEFLSIWFLLLPLLSRKEKKTLVIRKTHILTIALCLCVCVSGWLGAADLLHTVEADDRCLAIMPFHTTALEHRLTELTDAEELETTADQILKLNRYSSIAHSARANAALAKGNVLKMMTEKEQAIACARYSPEEYADYFEKLYAVMYQYYSAGDISSAEVCRQKLLEIPQMLSETRASTGSIAVYLGDQPELTLPQEYLEIVSSLQQTES
ncbi:MAG: O-antigen ligase family protein [Faecousia sp.]